MFSLIACHLFEFVILSFILICDIQVDTYLDACPEIDLARIFVGQYYFR